MRPRTAIVRKKGTSDFFHNKCWIEYKTAFLTRLDPEQQEGEPFGEEVHANHLTQKGCGKCYWCRKVLS